MSGSVPHDKAASWNKVRERDGGFSATVWPSALLFCIQETREIEDKLLSCVMANVAYTYSFFVFIQLLCSLAKSLIHVSELFVSYFPFSPTSVFVSYFPFSHTFLYPVFPCLTFVF